jgi:hypothetical protein
VSLLDEVLAAHGGVDAWSSARELTVQLRSGGLALRSKFAGGPFRRYEARIDLDEPRAVLTPYPAPGRRGIFERHRVAIESDAGEPVAERDEPRALFPRGRRRLWWDRLDALHFAGYALWNYFTTPLLLTRDGVELREEGRTLHATFPPELPTHSREQAFHFDERGFLTRHDYTAEVFGGWARAHHASWGHRSFDGLVFPTHRRVTPAGRRLPVLVWIEVDSVQVGPRVGTSG